MRDEDSSGDGRVSPSEGVAGRKGVAGDASREKSDFCWLAARFAIPCLLCQLGSILQLVAFDSAN